MKFQIIFKKINNYRIEWLHKIPEEAVSSAKTIRTYIMCLMVLSNKLILVVQVLQPMFKIIRNSCNDD